MQCRTISQCSLQSLALAMSGGASMATQDGRAPASPLSLLEVLGPASRALAQSRRADAEGASFTIEPQHMEINQLIIDK